MKPGSIEWGDFDDMWADLECIYDQVRDLRYREMKRCNDGARADMRATAALLRALEDYAQFTGALAEALRLHKEGL
jgi:hypothetical protein